MNPAAKLTLELTLADVETALKGLGKLPLEESANTFFAIRAQRDAFLRPPVAKPEPESTATVTPIRRRKGD